MLITRRSVVQIHAPLPVKSKSYRLLLVTLFSVLVGDGLEPIDLNSFIVSWGMTLIISDNVV